MKTKQNEQGKNDNKQTKNNRHMNNKKQRMSKCKNYTITTI